MLGIDVDEASETDVTPTGNDERQPRTFCGWPVTEDIKIPDHWPLARGSAVFAGEPVAVVWRPTSNGAGRPGVYRGQLQADERGDGHRRHSRTGHLSCTKSSAPTSATSGHSEPGDIE